jgi:hypothetical protein
LNRLVSASGLALSELEFFRYSGAWHGPLSPASVRDCRYGNGTVAATGLACFTLVRENRSFSRVRRRLRAWRNWLTARLVSHLGSSHRRLGAVNGCED